MTGNIHERRAEPSATGDEQTLGAALGRAIGTRVEATVPLAPPPLAAMGDRAAARARVRAAQRTVMAVAASVLVVVGGVVGWNAWYRQDTTTVFVSSEQVLEPSTGTVPVTAAPGPAGSPPDESQESGTPTPHDLSTGPALEWTEIDPGFADLFSFTSLDSGRVIARAWAIGDELVLDAKRAVYTDDGIDWTELPLPEGIVVDGIDNSGDRWLAYGWTHGSEETREFVDRVFVSDDGGAAWTEVILDLPADSRAVPSDCDRFLIVDSASLADDGFAAEIWGYRVSGDPSTVCPDVQSMRLVWSDGATTQLPSQRKDPMVIARNYDAYIDSNGFTASAVDDVLTVQRTDNGELVSTTATFEGLFPTWTLAAGQAGVSMTAFPSLGSRLEASTIGGLPVWRDLDRINEPTGVPLWLGWSADGTDWGWQSLPDAFGITEGEPWAELGVGRDFVIARIETFTPPTAEELAAWQSDSCSDDPCSADPCSCGKNLEGESLEGKNLEGEAPAARWFIARVPQ